MAPDSAPPPPPFFFLSFPTMSSSSASAMRALFGRTQQQRSIKIGERIYVEVNILDLYTIQVDVTAMSVEDALQTQLDAFRAEISALEETRPHMLVQARIKRRARTPRAFIALSRA